VKLNIAKEVAAMKRMTMKELRARYAEAFGETTNANNRVWLMKRVAWRLQAQAEGDLSERAKQRAAELANDADLRLSPPKAPTNPPAPERTMTEVLKFETDDRLPPPGTVITRPYKGDELQVKVLAKGFEFEGQVFKTLSAVAKAITGSHCNGYLFFRMKREVAP
jgi:Protein of unknown function (DUF2924)